MNDEVRLPIETVHDGEKTTKICVEDMYKAVNRIIEKYNDFVEYADKAFEEVGEREATTESGETWTGCLVVGKGISQPCHGDTYDEQIGNDIAFMKAKLNANIKKWNYFVKLWNANIKLSDALDYEIKRIQNNIMMDLDGLREYNPEYLKGIEVKLGFYEV